MTKKIIGAGGGGKGGGGGGGGAKEDPNTLQSKAYATVIDLVSEGEIGGLVNGAKSVFFDGTPLQNDDGSFNFSGYAFDSRNGTQSQDYIPGYPAAENEVTVNTEVVHDTPIVRTITNSNVDRLNLKITLPALSNQNTENGDLYGTEVSFRIDRQANGGGYVTVVSDTIKGKCTSRFQRAYDIPLDGDPPWDIRVVRLTADANRSGIQNKTYWESYTEIIDAKVAYVNSALVAVKIDASQFSSIPTRSYDLKGLKVRVPTNYNPTTRAYTGTWDGTFKIAWTDNPAWCFYDLLTSTRYGLGGFIPEAQVDKWSLYTIGKYCDELIPDGFGGTEPRFTCNLYIQTRAEAFKVIQDMASVFRAMVYWAGGTITTTQDAPSDPVHLYTSANVVDGSFSYSGSSAKARHTVALVTWNDPENQYKQKVEYVEDVDGIARFGVVETQVAAVGCTSRGQAHRVGKWLLYTEQNQTETVTFKTGLQGSTVRPGDVVAISDPMRAGSRRGGLISSGSTTSSIVLDQELAINPATHTLSVLLPDGTVEEKQIVDVAGNVVTVAELSAAPQQGAVWMLSSIDIEPQLFKVVSVVEEGGGVHSVTGLAHDPQKYDVIENSLVLEPRAITSLTSVPDAPQNIQIIETLYSVGADVRVKISISWTQVDRAVAYLVIYQRDEFNPVTLPQTASNDIEILNAEPGTYNVSVYAINAVGKRSQPGTATKTTLGKANPPSNMTGFSLIPNAGTAYLSWDKSIDLDVVVGGTVRIRFTPDIVTPLWKNSVDIVPAQPGNATRVQAPLLSGTYMAKFIDSSGVACNDAAVITTTVPEALALNVVETFSEDPDFAGTLTDMEYYGFFGGILLSANTLWDDIVDVDDVPSIDFAGGVASSGTYDFANVVDLTDVYTSRITANIECGAVDVTDTIDQRTENVDDWVDLDGEFIDDVNAELFLRTTDDDPADLGATWSDWKRFFVGEYSARGIQFQMRATSNYSAHNIVISRISVTVDMPDRTVNMPGLVSGTSTYSVAYPEGFAAVPSVGITFNNGNSGDYYQISNKTRSGFDIVFRNSSGTAVSRTFDVLAKGYGRQLN